MNKTTNTLHLYCKYKGWSGGTIHQAMKDFVKLPKEEKSAFCDILIKNMFNNTDMHGAEWFIKNK